MQVGTFFESGVAMSSTNNGIKACQVIEQEDGSLRLELRPFNLIPSDKYPEQNGKAIMDAIRKPAKVGNNKGMHQNILQMYLYPTLASNSDVLAQTSSIRPMAPPHGCGLTTEQMVEQSGRVGSTQTLQGKDLKNWEDFKDIQVGNKVTKQAWQFSLVIPKDVKAQPKLITAIFKLKPPFTVTDGNGKDVEVSNYYECSPEDLSII